MRGRPAAAGAFQELEAGQSSRQARIPEQTHSQQRLCFGAAEGGAVCYTAVDGHGLLPRPGVTSEDSGSPFKWTVPLALFPGLGGSALCLLSSSHTPAQQREGVINGPQDSGAPSCGGLAPTRSPVMGAQQRAVLGVTSELWKWLRRSPSLLLGAALGVRQSSGTDLARGVSAAFTAFAPVKPPSALPSMGETWGTSAAPRHDGAFPWGSCACF